MEMLRKSRVAYIFSQPLVVLGLVAASKTLGHSVCF
jgi:hypothetical protein